MSRCSTPIRQAGDCLADGGRAIEAKALQVMLQRRAVKMVARLQCARAGHVALRAEPWLDGEGVTASDRDSDGGMTKMGRTFNENPTSASSSRIAAPSSST